MISKLTLILTLALSFPAYATEVCFSPDEPCGEKITAFVAGAKSSIDLAIYDVNLGPLTDKLIALAKSIPVRVIVDLRQSKGSHSLVSKLIQAKVNVKYGHQRGIMHNKFVIVDGKAMETGSFNYTNHASLANNENQIYLSDPVVVDRYRSRFERIWAAGLAPTP
ncbi:MAG: phospholipase D-like domain-containing protein [Bdellovibrionota bacterium]